MDSRSFWLQMYKMWVEIMTNNEQTRRDAEVLLAYPPDRGQTLVVARKLANHVLALLTKLEQAEDHRSGLIKENLRLNDELEQVKQERDKFMEHKDAWKTLCEKARAELEQAKQRVEFLQKCSRHVATNRGDIG